MSPKNKLGIGFRWIGRIWSLASLAFLFTFIVGHLFGNSGRAPSGLEWLGLGFFPVGVMLGLIVAWWKEGIGGGVVVASLAAFYVWDLSVSGNFPGGPEFALIAAPGAFFLLSACVHSMTET